MSNQEPAPISSTFPIEEITRYHPETVKSSGIKKPTGKLLTAKDNDIVRFNGYYALDITAGQGAGKKGAFFTIDTNMYVTTDEAGTSTAQYYLQFILSMDGKSSVKFPFTGTFKKLGSGDYELHQPATAVGGMSDVDLNLTFSRSQAGTTATLNGKIVTRDAGQLPATVSGSTYNNPILPSTYTGTYYGKEKTKTKTEKETETLKIGKNHELHYKFRKGDSLQRIDTYTFDLNMYVFSFNPPKEDSTTISLVMGTSPNSGLVCGDIETIKGNDTQRPLHAIKSPKQPPVMDPLFINWNSSKLAPFSAYYPTPTSAHPGAFIAIQANRIPIIGALDTYAVMIGVSIDGKTSTVYNFDDSMSFDETTNTLKIPNPVFKIAPETGESTTPTEPEYILDISFTRKYIKEGMSGQLIEMAGHIAGEAVNACTPFNLIPLDGFSGATLTNSAGDTLVVNGEHEVTYKGKPVGAYHHQSILYVPIMYILEFTNPESPEIDILGMEYKVVCSFGTDAEQGLACIVTEYTLTNKIVTKQFVTYYHSVPKATHSTETQTSTEKPALA